MVPADPRPLSTTPAREGHVRAWPPGQGSAAGPACGSRAPIRVVDCAIEARGTAAGRSRRSWPRRRVVDRAIEARGTPAGRSRRSWPRRRVVDRAIEARGTPAGRSRRSWPRRRVVDRAIEARGTPAGRSWRLQSPHPRGRPRGRRPHAGRATAPPHGRGTICAADPTSPGHARAWRGRLGIGATGAPTAGPRPDDRIVSASRAPVGRSTP